MTSAHSERSSHFLRALLILLIILHMRPVNFNVSNYEKLAIAVGEKGTGGGDNIARSVHCSRPLH